MRRTRPHLHKALPMPLTGLLRTMLSTWVSHRPRRKGGLRLSVTSRKRLRTLPDSQWQPMVSNCIRSCALAQPASGASSLTELPLKGSAASRRAISSLPRIVPSHSSPHGGSALTGLAALLWWQSGAPSAPLISCRTRLRGRLRTTGMSCTRAFLRVQSACMPSYARCWRGWTSYREARSGSSSQATAWVAQLRPSWPGSCVGSPGRCLRAEASTRLSASPLARRWSSTGHLRRRCSASWWASCTTLTWCRASGAGHWRTCATASGSWRHPQRGGSSGWRPCWRTSGCPGSRSGCGTRWPPQPARRRHWRPRSRPSPARPSRTRPRTSRSCPPCPCSTPAGSCTSGAVGCGAGRPRHAPS
mmetsp:Transcript_31496/g.96791  ORF Transcript_31496/g.96791 Transcript_31496/m.96791 type:complete len:360 (+) Transcript_31496:469-1548(+)